MKQLKMIALLLAGVLLLALFGCSAENITPGVPEENGNEDDIVSDISEEDENEKLSFTYTEYSYKDNIEVEMVFMHTKEDLDAFCDAYGEKIGDKFMQDVAKYDDAFFEKNTLLFWCYDLISTNESEVLSIEHIKLTPDSYIVNRHDKINLGGDPGWVVGYSSWLIAIEGKHAMTEENITINTTQETFYPD